MLSGTWYLRTFAFIPRQREEYTLDIHPSQSVPWGDVSVLSIRIVRVQVTVKRRKRFVLPPFSRLSIKFLF